MSIKSQIKEIVENPIKSILDSGIDANSPISVHIAELIRLNEDAALGFRRAAEMMEDAQNELLFTTYANQRERFANTLKSHADVKTTKEGRSKFAAFAEDIAAQAHRAWMGLKASLSDSKLRTMLEESLRGDEFLTSHYDHAVKASDSRSDLHNLLTAQRADIKAVTQTLRRLIDETAAMS
jgi:uncharacterized protein (TIGR02284 family)